MTGPKNVCVGGYIKVRNVQCFTFKPGINQYKARTLCYNTYVQRTFVTNYDPLGEN